MHLPDAGGWELGRVQVLPCMTIEEAERIVAERRKWQVVSNTGENTGDSGQQMRGTGSNPVLLKCL